MPRRIRGAKTLQTPETLASIWGIFPRGGNYTSERSRYCRLVRGSWNPAFTRILDSFPIPGRTRFGSGCSRVIPTRYTRTLVPDPSDEGIFRFAQRGNSFSAAELPAT